MSDTRLSFHDVTVDFGVTRALDSISVDFAPGQIIGLLGHNGAGKSTLVNAATGALRPTRGQMMLDGRVVSADIPKKATELGISVIHQTPALAGNLSVLDNLYLGRPTTGRRRGQRAMARGALARAGGPDIPLDIRVELLELGQRQVVDLARNMLVGEIRVLFLDEPTAALGKSETDALHSMIRQLAASGTTVVYVSHRLPDVIDVCDRVVILREGRVVDDRPVAGLNSRSLAAALVPEFREDLFAAATPGNAVLRIGSPQSMVFHAGEVVGLFGVAAGEQFTLLDALHGGGTVAATVDGAPYRASSPADAIAKGVHLVVADRDRDGLIAEMSAVDNVYLPWRGKRHNGRQVAYGVKGRNAGYARMRETLSILGPGRESPISSFSGGNRQKHLLATWLYPVTPRILLLSQPTQGVDVGAKVDIRRAVRAAAASGSTVLVASAESDEISGMCDRSYVLHGGSAAAVPRTDDFDASLLQTLLDLIPAKEVAA